MAVLTWGPGANPEIKYGVSGVRVYKGTSENASASLIAKWDGVISIEEASSQSELEVQRLDNRVVRVSNSPEAYSATVRCFSIPQEMYTNVGDVATRAGCYITNQPSIPLAMSWITSRDGLRQYHVVYNTILKYRKRDVSTDTNTRNPTIFELSLNSSPYTGANARRGSFQPRILASHFIFDERWMNEAQKLYMKTLLDSTFLALDAPGDIAYALEYYA